jgi:hypothetical protein
LRNARRFLTTVAIGGDNPDPAIARSGGRTMGGDHRVGYGAKCPRLGQRVRAVEGNSDKSGCNQAATAPRSMTSVDGQRLIVSANSTGWSRTLEVKCVV